MISQWSEGGFIIFSANSGPKKKKFDPPDVCGEDWASVWVEQVGVCLLLTGAGRLRVDVQVGGGRTGLKLLPGQPGLPRGGDDPQPGQLGLTAALDGDRALADTQLLPAAGGGKQSEEDEADHGHHDAQQTEGDDSSQRILGEDISAA